MIHEFFTKSRSEIAFSLSTKDRAHLTQEMLPPFLEEGPFDLFWLDGSSTREGQQLPFAVQNKSERVREIHTHVYGGPDVAIVLALTRMIQCGYRYCGLIENDVKLKPGWFANLVSLFETGQKEGLKVGAVGSRTYHSRVLVPRGDFAVMFNLGAGMILFSQEAAKIVLNGFRTTNVYEVFAAALYTAGVLLKAKSGAMSSSAQANSVTTADWWFDSMLQLNGYCSLAPAPTMAMNIDPEAQALLGDDYVQAKFTASTLHEDSFQKLKKRQAALAAAPREDRLIAHSRIFLSNPDLGNWIVLPHQALTLGGCSLVGEWTLKWNQTWGPFNFLVQNTASVLRFKCLGDSCGVFFLSGPTCGIIEAQSGGLAMARINLRHEREQVVRVQLQMPHFDDWQIEIHPLAGPETGGQRVQWAGLSYKDVQPWFSVNTGFDFSVLERFVPKA